MTSATSTKRRAADKGQAPGAELPTNTTYLTQLDPDSIVVADDRLRKLDQGVAEAIARSMEIVGQLQPILVSLDVATGLHHLDIGLHRNAAKRLLGQPVDALVRLVADYSDHQRRLAEIFENLIRPDLKALERAIFLADLKRVHEEMHPEARNGGDRRSAAAKLKRDQNEIFSSVRWRLSALGCRPVPSRSAFHWPRTFPQ